MATSKLNAVQYTNLENDAKGVLLVYTDSKENKSAQLFFGEGYVPANKSQDEVFKVWRNIVTTFWKVKQVELSYRTDNDGIRSKLRASTPTEIIFRAENGDTKRFELSMSVWSKIGLIPTKKDLERLVKERDFKASIHKAAKASFDALGFRVALEKDETAPMPITLEQPVTSEVEIPEVQAVEQTPVVQSAETVTVTIIEQPVPETKTEKKSRQRIGVAKDAA